MFFFSITECKFYTKMQPASYMYIVDGLRQMSCNFMHFDFQCENVNILSAVNILCRVIATLSYQVMLMYMYLLCSLFCSVIIRFASRREHSMDFHTTQGKQKMKFVNT